MLRRRRQPARDRPDTDLASLRHPAEHSRLVIAVTAAVVLAGLAAVLFVRRVEREQVVLTVAVVPAFVLLGWGGLQLWRAQLLGSAVRVSAESLPELSRLFEDVRARLDYRRRLDVYVSDRVSGQISLTSLFGTRLIVIEGDLVATLLDGRRAELEFLLARFVGALKARHLRLAPVRAMLMAAKPLGVVNLFVWPYDRAVVYSGDQIGLACCGDLPAALNALDRLLVGGTLADAVLDAGILAQASDARRQRLPRAAQLLSGHPHLTSRYVNLLAFAERHMPEAFAAMAAALDAPSAERLAALAARTPHGAADRRRRRWPAPATGAFAAAAVVAVALLLLPTAGEQGGAPLRDPHLALLGHVPAPIADTCVRGQDLHRSLRPGLAASVLCTAAGPSAVEYYRYGQRRAMLAAFGRISSAAGGGDCSDGDGRETYSAGDPPRVAGRRACWSASGASVMAWTDDARRIVAVAVGRGMASAELERWWQSEAGPI